VKGALELDQAERCSEDRATRFEQAAGGEAIEPDGVVADPLEQVRDDVDRAVVACDAQRSAARRARSLPGHTFDAGGGRVGTTFQGTNAGYYDREMTPEALLANWDIVLDHSAYTEFDNGYESLSMVQTARENAKNRDT
jgi:hypothetical protein